MRSIRKFVGGGAAVLALGGFLAVIVAPQLAAAGAGHRDQAGAAVAHAVLQAHVLSIEAANKARIQAVRSPAAATTSCASAKQTLNAANAKDKAENAAELAAGKPADPNEDKSELAALKPLLDSIWSACGLMKPTPSSQCTESMQAVKAAIQKESVEDGAERTAGTESAAGDTAEDQSERAKMLPTWNAVRVACGFGAGGKFGTGQFSFGWNS
jgi:hypothetical protein